MKDTRDLNKALLATLTDLIDGKVTPQHAQAVARVASTVVSVARLEIEHSRFVSENRKTESVGLV